MHYKTTYLSFELDSVDKFTNKMLNVDNLLSSNIKISYPLDGTCKVKILKPIDQ